LLSSSAAASDGALAADGGAVRGDCRKRMLRVRGGGKMIKRFFGVNIAVRDLQEAIPKFATLLGVKPRIVSDPKSYAFPGITGAAFELEGVVINLLASTSANNPVEKFLRDKGEGILLISLLSDDLDKDVADLASKGMKFISPQAFAGDYGQVNFIHPKTMNGVQVEVIEPAKASSVR
jgi:methylmalonyl-CoA/ethylmalonyl-CoA epimerase